MGVPVPGMRANVKYHKGWVRVVERFSDLPSAFSATSAVISFYLCLSVVPIIQTHEKI